MDDDGVRIAFELILEEIGSVSKELKDKAKQLVDKGEFEAVRELMDTGKALDDYQLRVKKLQDEWVSRFNSDTRRLTVYEPEKKARTGSDSVYVSMNYGKAKASGKYENGDVILLKGSTIRKKVFNSLRDGIVEMRRTAINKGKLVDSGEKDLLKLNDPIRFSSSSAAAKFVAGCSVSGPRKWRVDEEDITLRQWVYGKE